MPVSDPSRYKLKDLFVKIDKFNIRFLYIIQFPSLFYTESKYTDNNNYFTKNRGSRISCEKATLSRCLN
jgi:hypothetical protein